MGPAGVLGVRAGALGPPGPGRMAGALPRRAPLPSCLHLSWGRRQSTVTVGGLSSPFPGISCTLTSAPQVLPTQGFAKLCLQRAGPKLLPRGVRWGVEASKGLESGGGAGTGLSDNVL